VSGPARAPWRHCAACARAWASTRVLLSAWGPLRAARQREGGACGRADFGLSINEGKSVAKSMDVGTPGYCAPELLLRTHMVSSYDGKKADGAPTLLCPTFPKPKSGELL
jgi:serine/threonine protein kinase